METLSEKLTEREVEILERLARGLSDQQIAAEIYLSLNTVKWYNRQIYSKLGVANRTQAIARARDLRLFGEEPLPAREVSSLPQAVAYHLPAEITSFIGRRSEIAEISRLIQNNRLVTLVGPPGSGKTRLSLQVAREVAGSFREGVYFVPLAPVQAVENLLWAITEPLDFQFESRGEPLKQLLTHLRAKSLLLVLDNFEHLISGGGLLTEILRAAPEVKILVTSRERLNLYGEVSYSVGGLLLPADSLEDQAARSEAVALFLERARAVSPARDWNPDDLPHIVRICRLVEGMPLGIELAASWLDTLLPGEIADEIERDLDILQVERQDLPQSQRSLRAAFDRSWNLLDERQQAAFRRLSVFRGGLTREAGEAIAGVGLRPLQALVNKSLLRHNSHTGRYDIHEILRHYAGEQLQASGEAEQIRRAHAAYFADFMAERWPRLKDHRQKEALQEIRADYQNARLAWQYWVEAGEVAQLKKFLHSFWVFFDIQGWYPAGIDLFEAGAEVMRAAGTEEAQACLGWLLAVQGLFRVPVEDYQELSDEKPPPLWLATHGLYNAIGVGSEVGFNLAQTGVGILKRLGKYPELMVIPLISLFLTASQMPDEGHTCRQAALDILEAAEKIDDRWAIARAKQYLAVLEIEAGEYEKAERMAHEALVAFEASGDHWSTSVLCIEVLGLLFISLRRFDQARDWIRRGLQAAEEIDFKYSIQTAYWQLGYVAALEEDYAEAGLHWKKALQVSDRMLGGRSFLGFGNRGR